MIGDGMGGGPMGGPMGGQMGGHMGGGHMGGGQNQPPTIPDEDQSDECKQVLFQKANLQDELMPDEISRDVLVLREQELALGCVHPAAIADTHVDMGNQYLKIDDKVGARQHFVVAPDFAQDEGHQAMLGADLGKYMFHEGLGLEINMEYSEAQRAYQTAVSHLGKANPHDTDAMKTRLQVYEVLGNYAGALDVYKQIHTMLNGKQEPEAEVQLVLVMIRMVNMPFECDELEAVLEQMSETCMLAVGHAAMSMLPKALLGECRVMAMKAKSRCAAVDGELEDALSGYSSARRLATQMSEHGMEPFDPRQKPEPIEPEEGDEEELQQGRTQQKRQPRGGAVKNGPDGSSYKSIRKAMTMWAEELSVQLMSNLRSGDLALKANPPAVEGTPVASLVEYLDATNLDALSVEEFQLTYVIRNRPVLFDYAGMARWDTVSWGDHGAFVKAFGDAEFQTWAYDPATGTPEKTMTSLRHFAKNMEAGVGMVGSTDIIDSPMPDDHPFVVGLGKTNPEGPISFFTREPLLYIHENRAADDLVDFQYGPANSGVAPKKQRLFHQVVGRWEALVSGSRRWYMWPPHCNFQAGIPFGTTVADWSTTMLPAMLESAGACAPMVFEQGPGQVVFVPANWGYAFMNLATSSAVAGVVGGAKVLDMTWQEPDSPTHDEF